MLSKDLHQVICKLTSSEIKTDDGVGESITFIHRNTMGNTISRVHDNTSGTTRGIKRKDSLDGNIHGRHVEGLKHDLGHLLTVSLWVKGSLSKENWLFFRGNTELIVEGVMPDLFHVIPVGDDSMLNRVLKDKRMPMLEMRLNPREVSLPLSTLLSMESSPTGMTWKRSGITPSTMSSVLPLRNNQFSLLRLPLTQRLTVRR